MKKLFSYLILCAYPAFSMIEQGDFFGKWQQEATICTTDINSLNDPTTNLDQTQPLFDNRYCNNAEADGHISMTIGENSIIEIDSIFSNESETCKIKVTWKGSYDVKEQGVQEENPVLFQTLVYNYKKTKKQYKSKGCPSETDISEGRTNIKIKLFTLDKKHRLHLYPLDSNRDQCTNENVCLREIVFRESPPLNDLIN